MALISETHTHDTAQSAHPNDPAVLISRNPATGEELGRVPILGLAEVDVAVARARVAQQRWSALPLQARLAHLTRVRDALATRISELSDLIALEMGKHPTEALLGDVMFGLTHLHYAIRNAPRLLKPKPVRHSLLFATRRAR